MAFATTRGAGAGVGVAAPLRAVSFNCMSLAVSFEASGWAAAGGGTTEAIEALAFTMMSRVASEENQANKLAARAAATTASRIFDETEVTRLLRRGVMNS